MHDEHHWLHRPFLVHSSVLFPPGKTSGDPEQGAKDTDRLPSKGRGVLRLSWDWGPLPAGALRTVFLAFSCKRPLTHATQSFHSHLPFAPSGQLSRPCFTVPLEACGLEVTTPVDYPRRPLKRGTPRTTGVPHRASGTLIQRRACVYVGLWTMRVKQEVAVRLTSTGRVQRCYSECMLCVILFCCACGQCRRTCSVSACRERVPFNLFLWINVSLYK